MNILSIELIKTNRLGNYIMLGIIVLVSILFPAIFFHIITKNQLTNGEGFLSQSDSLTDFVVRFVFMIAIILNIGSEFSEKTLRRAVIDGYDRNRFFTGKIIITLVFTVAVYILLKLVLMGAGLMSGHFNMVSAHLTLIVLLSQFLTLAGNGILAFFLVFLTQSTVVSIIISFVWFTLEGALIGLLPQLWDGWQPVYADYFPVTVIHKIFSLDVAEPHAIVIAFIYLSIMLFVPYFLFTKRDIK